MAASAKRQAAADKETYSDSPMLLSAQSGIYDISTTPRDDDNKEGTNERIQNDGIDKVTSPLKDDEGGGGTGAGLPEFPSDIPAVPDFKGVLMWSVAEEEALWLNGAPVLASDPKTYLDVLAYQPDPATDNFNLIRYESLEVIICQDGEPVTGSILFEEANPQP